MFTSKDPGDTRQAERRLVERCRAGDEEAFEEIYRRHAGRLFNLAHRMAPASQDAEDLLQEIFLLAYRKLDSFRGDASLGTWLYRLAMNHCLDVLRHRQTRMGQQTDSIDAPETPELANRVPALGGVSRIDLERAIAELPPACRAAFVLHDVEGFGHQEVATILGVTEGTSKSQVHKARLRIRTALLRTRRPAPMATGPQVR
jgi:RNA polymerase sigma-70 factor (ECF subfamily)